jgi:predicted Zn-dependent protease
MRHLHHILLGQPLWFARYSNRPDFNGGPVRSAASGCTSGCLSNPRVLLAILMVVGYTGYYFFFTASYNNPITGRTQRLAMPTAQEEVAMGLQSAPQMIREFGGQHPNREAQNRLDEIGAKLVQSSSARNTEYQWDFHLLNDNQTVNAFALPGGQIFITAKLFSLLKNEDQLAGVLGHEIGHVVGRHSNQQMAKSTFIGGLAQAAGMLLSDGGQGGIQIAQMVGNVINMKYGRDDELESDALGVRFMLDAGYQPEELIGVMEILAEHGGGGAKAEFMSSHPDPGNRIQHIKNEIRRYRSGERARIPSAEAGTP